MILAKVGALAGLPWGAGIVPTLRRCRKATAAGAAESSTQAVLLGTFGEYSKVQYGTHACTHTHTHTHMNSLTHACTRTHTHAHATHTHKHARTRARTHTHLGTAACQITSRTHRRTLLHTHAVIAGGRRSHPRPNNSSSGSHGSHPRCMAAPRPLPASPPRQGHSLQQGVAPWTCLAPCLAPDPFITPHTHALKTAKLYSPMCKYGFIHPRQMPAR